MQKVYRLLRNNQETGPYSLEEILQLQLKAFDLVWVEGRSAAWRYPGEIDSLKPYVPETPKPQQPFKPIATEVLDGVPPVVTVQERPPSTSNLQPKKIFVSMPGKSSESVRSVPQEAKAHQPYMPREQQPPRAENAEEKEPVLQTTYARSLEEVEEDYTKWMYQNKTRSRKGLNKKDIGIAAVALLLIAAGYAIFSEPAIIAPATQQAAKAEVPVTINDPSLPAAVESETAENAGRQPEQLNEPLNKEKTGGQAASRVPVKKPTQETLTSTISPPESGTAGKEVVIEEDKEMKQEEVQTESPQKKKKLGEVLKGIFTRKEKQQESTAKEEAPPATNRQSTRREESEEATEMDRAELLRQIDISSNNPDNWMMGVTGLKVTLRNRNAVALQKAQVQVSYFDDHNQLLDKKTLYFNNVAAKGKMTLAAPDHKYADHIELQLGNVTAREDRYASQ